ncbi:hypothetical protein B0J14DRAFT_696928 [Halenospora varia]|nr:hypothetical protein B0J14DRAFT_696928 [Halenospora varia]
MSGTYKPTEHGGMKEDGTPDKRIGTGEFAQGEVDPHEAGKQGGQSSGGSASGASQQQGDDYKPTEHGGLTQDGQPDRRVKGN